MSTTDQSRPEVDAERPETMPTYPAYWSTDRGSPSEFLVERSTHDLGNAPVPKEVFTSREYAEREKRLLWKKTWQAACRGNEVPNVGDQFVYDIVGQSVVIVRESADKISAFYNACRHRGTRLVEGSNSAGTITCPFHAWSWKLDGSLNRIPCRWDFPERSDDELGLVKVQVDTFDGWVFINFDPDAEPLADFLGPDITTHLGAWPRTHAWKAGHIAKVLPCNWKLALEAFLEGYHTVGTHPQILPYLGDCNCQYDFYGPHSRMIGAMGVPSPHLGEIEAQVSVDGMVGDAFAAAFGDHAHDHEIPQLAPGQSSREFLSDFMRQAMSAQSGFDYSSVSDAEVLDGIEYHVFPNLVPWGGYSLPMVYRVRPHGDDPGQCLWEVMVLQPMPEGSELPPDAPMRMLPLEQPWNDAPEMGGMGQIMDQDTSNILRMQRGIACDSVDGLILANYQERNIRNFHQHVDRYLAEEA